MTTPAQREVRTWARAQGLTLGDRGRLPATVMQAYAAAHGGGTTTAGPEPAPSVAGLGDLAGGLRAFVDAVDGEVRAVSFLAERIDALVGDLNALRKEQATRLLVLDDLHAVADESSLRTFLAKTIQPTTTRVPEIVPARLQ